MLCVCAVCLAALSPSMFCLCPFLSSCVLSCVRSICVHASMFSTPTHNTSKHHHHISTSFFSSPLSLFFNLVTLSSWSYFFCSYLSFLLLQPVTLTSGSGFTLGGSSLGLEFSWLLLHLFVLMDVILDDLILSWYLCFAFSYLFDRWAVPSPSLLFLLPCFLPRSLRVCC